ACRPGGVLHSQSSRTARAIAPRAIRRGARSRAPVTLEVKLTEEEKRALRNARARERYAKDPEFRASKQAYRRTHKEQRNARHRERYATDPEYRAKFEHFRLKTRYGLSAEEYSAMLARQRYACGICERPFVSTPHVDHCHTTRWVRGLLCRSCNFGLGYF